MSKQVDKVRNEILQALGERSKELTPAEYETLLEELSTDIEARLECIVEDREGEEEIAFDEDDEGELFGRSDD